MTGPLGPLEPVEAVLALLRDRPATLGDARLVCIDGPGGSGKTTLARALAGATGAPVVHLDDLYDGWAGLGHADAQLATLLLPLADGEPGHYRRYDWHAGAFAETVTVAPADLTADLTGDLTGGLTGGLLVLEGVGAGSSTYADLATVLVWVEAPRDVRLRRGLERDGDHLHEHWRAWQVAEDAHHATHRTRDRADVLVDGAAPAG